MGRCGRLRKNYLEGNIQMIKLLRMSATSHDERVLVPPFCVSFGICKAYVYISTGKKIKRNRQLNSCMYV